MIVKSGMHGQGGGGGAGHVAGAYARLVVAWVGVDCCCCEVLFAQSVRDGVGMNGLMAGHPPPPVARSKQASV